MLLSLYPDERPVYPTMPGGGSAVCITLRHGEKLATAVCRLTVGGQTARGQARIPAERLTGGLETSRLEQRIVKLSFYRAALALGHPRPAWGCLTGVRPGKFLTALEKKDGLSPRAAAAMLCREFDVSPERAELCAHAAHAAEEVRAGLSERDIGLYIGIPFCPTRCAYCSFISVDAPQLLEKIPAYLEALEQDMAFTARAIREAKARIVSVYVGGGTPTTLSAPELDRMLSQMEHHFDLSACREITVEAGRPDTVTKEKLAALTAHRVDRVSVNPQTMSDDILRAIGRRHTVQQIRDAMAMVKSTSLVCNMDLIAGLPGDTPESFADTVEQVLALSPENITVHTLALKKGSRFLTEGAALPGDGDVSDMLDAAREKLVRSGYAPYYLYRQKFMSGSFENVGWTKPGYRNLYNICIMEELCSIVSVGAGGSTKLVGKNGYIERLSSPKYPREYMERAGDLWETKQKIPAFFAKEAVKGEK